jgi:transcription initiation factor TFIIA large subunit
MPSANGLPAGSLAQQQFQQQQQQAMQRQQQAMQQQQVKPPMQQQQYQQQPQQQMPRLPQPQPPQQPAQPAIKVENNLPSYTQTDGAADNDLAQWRAMLAERRAMAAEQTRQADRMMHDQVMQMTAQLSSGLMVALPERPSRRRQARSKTPREALRPSSSLASSSRLPRQLDGEDDDEDDDENAINSDLDDSDDEGPGNIGEDEDDEGDAILCTYDKVQRVKNKWKCTLKDGVMIVDGKDYVFHKATGEFEW